MPLLSIRPAAPADSAGIARLHYLSHTTSFRSLASEDWIAARDIAAYEEDWRRRLDVTDRLSLAWVAIERDEVVGIVSACAPAAPRAAGDGPAPAPIASIRALHVHPDRLGTGIGRRLWRAVCTALGERGFACARWDVIEANAQARRFFEAAGARPVGRSPSGVEGVPILTYEIDVSSAIRGDGAPAR